MPLDCRISTGSPTPIYRQLIDQIRLVVLRGRLTPGDRLPSVRSLAQRLVINPNTVARAYRQLQDDDVLTPIRGTGLAVASGARRACQSERKRLIRARLHDVLLEAHSSGLDEAQIHSIFKSEMTSAQRKQR